MKFEVIEAMGQEGTSCGKALKKKLDDFNHEKKNPTILFMTQGSFIMKNGAPYTILTICYTEQGRVEVV